MYDPKIYFSDEEIRQLRLLGASIRNNVIPIQYKDHFFWGNGQMWDIDTYTAECCQCLALPEDDYEEYLRPLRLSEITVNIEIMKRVCYNYKVNSMIKLCSICDFADTAIICEAGRGIDVLLASFVKPWRRIIAYDQDKGVLHEMKKYFRGELGLPLETMQIRSENFNFRGWGEKALVFGTCHNVDGNKFQEIKENDNLCAVFDGEFL